MSTFLRFAMICALALVLNCTCAAENSAKPARIALVVGNDRYETAIGRLRNTGNDAKAMAKVLREIGFTVIEKHNVTRDGMIEAMMQFRAKLVGADVALFYFAGHGISVSGSNYLIPLRSGYAPAEADPTTLRLVAETRLFNAEQAVADMSSAGARCNLVILDACRSTPVARNPQNRDATNPGGLAEMNPPAGSLIAFATDAGRTASDGDGKNGLYTEVLLQHLRTPGLTIEQVFKRTRANVLERSSGTQIPAEYSRLIGDDIFLAGHAIPKPAGEIVAPKARIVPLPTMAEINKLAAAGNAKDCIEALLRLTRSRNPDASAAAPLTKLLDHAKESLRDATKRTPRSDAALSTCDLVLSALDDLLPSDDPQRATLAAKAHNRRGDALFLSDHHEGALEAYNAAIALDPDDAYIRYNRGRTRLALGQTEDAKADFTTAANPKSKQSGARKLALSALEELKEKDSAD